MKKVFDFAVCCVAVLAVVVLGYLALNKFYMQPRKAEAKAQLFPAEASFRAQQWEVALKGDGNQLGFEQVIEEYGSKAGEAVYLYAGECELQLGNFESAISYLKKYSGKDDILAARALACEGDAYVGLEKYAEALECFEKGRQPLRRHLPQEGRHRLRGTWPGRQGTLLLQGHQGQVSPVYRRI